MDWKRFLIAASGRAVLFSPRQRMIDGGRMKVSVPRKKSKMRGSEVAAAFGGTALALVMGFAMVALNAPLDFGFLVTAFAGLCGLVIYDSVNRRNWEKSVTEQLNETIANQGTLVREVAANRADIAVLKDGLAETASALQAQAKRWPAAAASMESRMLKVITERLGMFGKRTVTPKSVSNHVVELEMAPPPRKAPQFSRIEQAMNGRKFTDTVVAELLHSAVRQDKIEMFAQPVVTLPQRRMKMVELFARVRARAGFYLPAERYMKVAANDHLLPAIDNLLLLHCLQHFKDSRTAVPDEVPCMLNVSAPTLRDTGFMNDLVTFLAKNRAMASRLVFELPQAELETLDPKVLPILDGLSKLGCRFSMDSVRKRRIDIALLRRLQIRFLKMDAAWLIREAMQDGGAARLLRLKKQLDAAGIDLIVERIESERELRELLDFNIDFGQGYLFGRPEPYTAWRENQIKQSKPVQIA